MKNSFKILALTLLFSVSTLSFAQSSKDGFGNKLGNATETSVNAAKNGVSIVYNDGKEATKEIYSQIKKASPKAASLLTKMAEKLEVTVDSVWSILVRQQFVWSICFLILTITSLLNWYLFYQRNISSNNILIDREAVILERDMIGDVINPKFDKYYFNKWENGDMDYRNDIRRFETIKGPIGGKEQYMDYKPTIDLTQEKTTVQIIFQAVHMIICLVLSYLSITNFAQMITGFYNPEFGAMTNILDFAMSFK